VSALWHSPYWGHAWQVTGELAPWLLLGAAVAGLLHVLLPPGFVRRQLRGRSGVLKAVALGVPLPLCSCGVIPAGIGLKADGASDGASVGFLTATPQTGVDSILVSGGMLGLPFALMKVVAALVTGLASGLLVDAAAASKDDDEAENPASAHDSHERTVGAALAHAVDMIRMIWRWLVFGILVSAALSTWLPAGSLGHWGLDGGVLAFGLVLFASVPLYVCATASVPIAAALVAGGMSTGAAMVFLMAGPATNVATLGAVWRAFGGRTLAIYLGTIVVGSVGFGLAYDALVQGGAFGAMAAGHVHHHGGMSWPALLSAVALIGMFVFFAGDQARSAYGQWRAAMADNDKRVIKVEGMTCGGCAARLERVLQRDGGVESASVSYEAGQAEVQGAVTIERITELVEGAGFDVVA